VVAVMVLVMEQKVFQHLELRQTITKQLIVVLMQIVVVEQVDQMVPLPLEQMA
tara:strand:+ start:409 stop:567 length:159 start_codon:yes stop_codon:yes gene_type:complete